MAHPRTCCHAGLSGRSQAAIIVALVSFAAPPAWAQAGFGALPATGANIRTENLRSELQQYMPNLDRTISPRWLIVPSLGVTAAATDNAGQTQQKSGDIYTIISPSISVIGDTRRLRINLNYAPQAYIFASQTNQTRLDHYLTSDALVTIAPDSVFLDLRGQISQLSRYGGFGQTDSQILSRQNQVQSITYGASPYATHTFGGWGTARISYDYLRTIQDGSGTSNNQLLVNNQQAVTVDAFGQLAPAFGSNGNLTTHTETASFTTGENFGRYNDTITVQAVQYSGGGSYAGAYRNSVDNQFGYAVTRWLTVLAGIGYQDIQYGGTPVMRINEPTWSIGAQLTPNPDSSLTFLYGRHDGLTSFSFDGVYTPTARTRVFGRYSTGLTSTLQDQQALVQTSTVNANGLLVDSRTGAPVGSGTSFLGTQNGVFQTRRFSISALLLLDRDSFTATVSTENRSQVTNGTNFNNTVVVPAGTTSNGTTGSLAWQHDFRPDLNGVASVQYGVLNTSGLLGASSGQSQRSLSLSAGLVKQFSTTVSGNVTYLYNDRSGAQGAVVSSGFPTANTSQNTLFVGLRKSF